MNNDIVYRMSIPEDVKVEVAGDIVKVTGPNGVVEKKMPGYNLKISTSENTVIIQTSNTTKREKKLANTYRAHIVHMVVGVVEGHTYKLKICSGHFPMSVSVKGEMLEVKNFLGENKPRLLKLKAGAKIDIQGEIITISSPDKELSGQVAADIEQLTRITGRDRRIFQDGIYIIEKSKARPILLAEVPE